MLQFVTFTLGIWIVRWERALSACLPKRQTVRFDTKALLRGRTLDRFKAYLLARQGTFMDVNEIRYEEGLPPEPDPRADDVFAAMNSSSVPPAFIEGQDEKDTIAEEDYSAGGEGFEGPGVGS